MCLYVALWAYYVTEVSRTFSHVRKVLRTLLCAKKVFETRSFVAEVLSTCPLAVGVLESALEARLARALEGLALMCLVRR